MPKTVTVISKEGCHLCEKVIEALNSLSRRYALEVIVLDIDDDPQLHDRYWLSIPVVRIDGKDVFDAKDMVETADYVGSLERLVSEKETD